MSETFDSAEATILPHPGQLVALLEDKVPELSDQYRRLLVSKILAVSSTYHSDLSYAEAFAKARNLVETWSPKDLIGYAKETKVAAEKAGSTKNHMDAVKHQILSMPIDPAWGIRVPDVAQARDLRNRIEDCMPAS